MSDGTEYFQNFTSLRFMKLLAFPTMVADFFSFPEPGEALKLELGGSSPVGEVGPDAGCEIGLVGMSA